MPKKVQLAVGETQQIETNLTAFNLFNNEKEIIEELKYTSVNEKIATVDENGLIEAKSYGITRIIVRDPLTEKIATVEVTILPEGGKVTPRISVGNHHTVALKADGTVWTWGYNGYGQLGNGNTNTIYAPEKIEIEDVVDVKAGENYTLVLKADGTVWAVGYNGNGQLGNGTTIRSLQFTQVMIDEETPLTNIEKIDAGQYSAFAVTKEGNVYGWGYNPYGELGIKNTASSYYAIQMLGYNGIDPIDNVLDVQAGRHHTVILKADGTVWTVGYNTNGEL